MINKNTKLFGSFSKRAGDQGCLRYNASFTYYNYDAIYKSFSVDNVEDIICATKILNFSGYAVSMPFKKEILSYMDNIDDAVDRIGAINTVVLDNGLSKGYNTDYLSIIEFIQEHMNNGIDFSKTYYCGNGGYASSFREASKILGIIEPKEINRSNWETLFDINDSVIFNCTPVENLNSIVDKSNHFIDCIPNTPTGIKLSMLQAKHQFKIFTGLDYPLCF